MNKKIIIQQKILSVLLKICIYSFIHSFIHLFIHSFITYLRVFMYPKIFLYNNTAGFSNSFDTFIKHVGIKTVVNSCMVSLHHLRLTVKILCEAYSSGVLRPEKEGKAYWDWSRLRMRSRSLILRSIKREISCE